MDRGIFYQTRFYRCGRGIVIFQVNLDYRLFIKEDYMEDFVLKKSKNSNVAKTIRFTEELNDAINEVIKNANKGKSKKKYSFNGFVISACEYAIKSMKTKK